MIFSWTKQKNEFLITALLFFQPQVVFLSCISSHKADLRTSAIVQAGPLLIVVSKDSLTAQQLPPQHVNDQIPIGKKTEAHKI